MRTSPLPALSILPALAMALALVAGAPRAVHAQDTTQVPATPLAQALTRIRVLGHERDSLARLADQATGEQRAILEEQVWQAQLAVQARDPRSRAEVEEAEGSRAATCPPCGPCSSDVLRRLAPLPASARAARAVC